MSPDAPLTDPDFLAAYGETVRRLREERGMDRKTLAVEAGISYSYLSAIESGQRFPSDSRQTLLAQALGVSASELLAIANGAVKSDPSPMTVSSVYNEAETVAHRMAPPAMARSEGAPRRITASAALAELRALLPQLSEEDSAMVVAMARRLGAETQPTPRRRRSTESRYRGAQGRQLRTTAYLEFWTRYLHELDRRGLEWGSRRRAEPRSYFTAPSPVRGSSLSASFARNRLLRHEMYINRGSREANLELLRDLKAHRDVIDDAYGGSLDFEDPGRERRAVRIAEYRDGHISRTDEYDDYIEWFIDRGIRLRRALEAYQAAAGER